MQMNTSASLITAFFFCLAILLVFDLNWVLLRTRLVYLFKDKPGTRKIHQRTIPRAGGICIGISLCAVLCLWHFSSFPGFPRLSPLYFNVCLLVASGIFFIGVFDDTSSFSIKNRAKFLLEFVIALEIVFLFGVQFTEINIMGLFVLKNRLILSLLSILWMVGVANAFNIIDGIDGLAGTLACISFFTTALLALHAHDANIAILSLVIAGCTIGFLFHNVSPARVFLGDTGSLLLGMLLAFFLMDMVANPRVPFSINTAFLIAGIPILDVAVAMGRRFFRALLSGKGLVRSLRSITVADSEHTHHRLVYRGLSHTQATIVIGTLSATLCVAAIHINLFTEFKYALVIYMAVVVFWFLYELNFFDRFIVFAKFLIHKRSKALFHRIAVIDADPILHHALIRFRQRKFTFDFVSHQDMETRGTTGDLPLEAVSTPTEQFFITAIWAQDTRKYSKEMISSVIKEWATEETGGATPGRHKAARVRTAADLKRAQERRPFSALLINCRDANELDYKIALGRQLVKDLECAVIMMTAHSRSFTSWRPRAIL